MDADSRVALAEIKGDVKLILAGQDRTNSDIKEIRVTLVGHGGRLGALETAKSVADGERKGIAHGGRALWALIGLLTSAIGAGLLRHFGV